MYDAIKMPTRIARRFCKQPNVVSDVMTQLDIISKWEICARLKTSNQNGSYENGDSLRDPGEETSFLISVCMSLGKLISGLQGRYGQGCGWKLGVSLHPPARIYSNPFGS